VQKKGQPKQVWHINGRHD